MRGIRGKVRYAAAASALSLAATLVVQPIADAQAPAPGLGGQQETVIIVLGGSCTTVAGASSPGATCTQQQPVLAQLQAAGATVQSTTSLIDAITATVSSGEAQALASFPGVSQVTPNVTIPIVEPAVPASGRPVSPVALNSPGWRGHGQGTPTCGTQRQPELDPEALQVINAQGALNLGIDGAGVTVATIADGIDTTNGDLQRNPAFGTPGQPVAQEVDFSGDPAGTPTGGGEMYLDVSSIAAQGNLEYNLSQYVNPGQAARLPASGCWIRIVGAAPGASVLALKAFSDVYDTTESNILQAIQYAVQHGVKVINESFGANNFPDTALDVTREADDAAVAAGVTVVVSSGDAGVTNTIGSPASDPNVISVGATTTFRSYAQANFGGFYNPSVGNGRWADNNLSDLSSGGFTQAGNTVNLVAPGDLNWALCSTNTTLYTDCSDIFGGTDIGIQQSGGTSEAAPLTSAAAADVIQAYAKTHGGTDPTPALVKQILVSTASDIDAPAQEQGAGLLDIGAAVQMAESYQAPVTHHPFGPVPFLSGGVLSSTPQVNFVGAPGSPQSQQISFTNTGSTWQDVQLSTRAMTNEVYDSGVQTFDMQPTNPTPNTGVTQIWSGVSEVYQTENFTVPWTIPGEPTRLVFSADYQYTGQGSLLHIALFEPDGTYAAYSLPQGLGDYAEVEVTDPVPGTWTALFFTEQDGATGPGSLGTSGPVQWDAQTWSFGPAGTIFPSHLDLAPGQTATATLSLTTPTAAGDTAQSIVVSTFGHQTTIPVTVRSMVPTGPSGGTFSGVLTGGNGRADSQAEGNAYFFDVPPGEKDLDVSLTMANSPSGPIVPGDVQLAYLIDPNGQNVGYSSNITYVPTSGGLEPVVSPVTQLYHVAPIPGQWELLVYWYNPVVGDELQDPFTGSVQFNQVSVTSSLPDSASSSVPGLTTTAYTVNVTNTGVAPEAFFVDPRLDNQTETLPLPNQNSAISANAFTIPLPPGLSFPYYLVPTHTTELEANVTSADGETPVTFDMEYFPGDPDVSPAVASPGTTGSYGPGSASLTFTESPEVSPGIWLVNPDEIGPYPSTGEPTDAASASLSAVTEAFDPAVTSATGNLWDGSLFNFLYLLPGESGSIEVDLTPSSTPGTVVQGTLYVDDLTLGFYTGYADPDGDELAAIPYEYTVG
ncbi:MAG TPA: S8 family serine peptidase [Acidimicrobiales bacterium]|nr:S8 family serine peptidase [Acidimicrobiales bacterium]